MLRTIRLYGHLAEKFGKLHHIDISTPAEAIRALCANFADFERIFVGNERMYRMTLDTAPLVLNVDNLHSPSGCAEIRIIPVIAGAGKGGLGMVLLGAAVLALCWWNPLGWVADGMMMTAASGIGAALIIGGIASMLVRSPAKTPQQNTEASYLFNGAVNNTAQGGPVPLGYGRMIVGSVVVSSSIVTQEYALDAP